MATNYEKPMNTQYLKRAVLVKRKVRQQGGGLGRVFLGWTEPSGGFFRVTIPIQIIFQP